MGKSLKLLAQKYQRVKLDMKVKKHAIPVKTAATAKLNQNALKAEIATFH